MIEKYLVTNAYHLVFINGHFVPYCSNAEKFITVANENVINFPENFNADKPIQLLFYTDGKSEEAEYILQNVIHVSKNSNLSLLETYFGEQKLYTSHINTTLFIHSGANLQYYKYQEENINAIHKANIYVEQRDNSHLKFFNFSYGCQISNDHLTINLSDKNAACEIYGLYSAINEQQVNHQTCIDHRAIQCSSRQLYKGILRDKGVSDFDGKIVVHPGAQNTKAHQKNHNLLLSKEAAANTKPELAIFADNVQCTHGATVGQLDEAALFYLRSRGISEMEGRQLLINAFANEVINLIDNNSIKMYLNKRSIHGGHSKHVDRLE